MAYTQLSPTATPGKRYSFDAKTEAVVVTRRVRSGLLLGIYGIVLRGLLRK